jgi:hypothetical protein
VDGPRELLGLGATGAIVPIGERQRAAEATAEVIAAPSATPLELEEWRPDFVRAKYRELFERLLDGSAVHDAT